ncbi:hypothetical protein QP178_08435 [Sphingomonas aurantiaca]|uniref:hypothetical protein n=1 Tax=Sphingomonas TaxID=13687 RepID=UPI000AD5F8F3|nr:hypothetical protein [Sphingomonas sp. Leaf28]
MSAESKSEMSAGNEPTRVFAIGSCRVHTPLKRALAAVPDMSYIGDPVFGFVHSTADIHQMLDVNDDIMRPPKELYSLLSIRNEKFQPDDESRKRRVIKHDVVVIEISSIRILKYGSYSLQINRLKEIVKERAGVRNEAVVTTSPRFAAVLALARSVSEGSDPVSVALREFDDFEQSPDDFYAAARSILDRLPMPVLLVPHVNLTSTGNPIPQRQIIRDALERIAGESENIRFYDPTALVRDVGYGAAMADSAHYQEDFELAMGEQLAAQIKGLLDR